MNKSKPAPLPERLSALDMLCLFYCRIGVAGLARPAPGTWGSAAAALLAPLCFVPLELPWRTLVLAGIFLTGSWAATRVEKLLQCKDPSQVVIDELLGVWLSLLPFATVSLPMLLASFALFRVFDILKPWPVSASEYWLPDGYGVMLDDAVAGLLTMPCLVLLLWAGVL